MSMGLPASDRGEGSIGRWRRLVQRLIQPNHLYSTRIYDQIIKLIQRCSYGGPTRHSTWFKFEFNSLTNRTSLDKLPSWAKEVSESSPVLDISARFKNVRRNICSLDGAHIRKSNTRFYLPKLPCSFEECPAHSSHIAWRQSSPVSEGSVTPQSAIFRLSLHSLSTTQSIISKSWLRVLTPETTTH